MVWGLHGSLWFCHKLTFFFFARAQPLHWEVKTTKSAPLIWLKFIWQISGFINWWVAAQKWRAVFFFSTLPSHIHLSVFNSFNFHIWFPKQEAASYSWDPCFVFLGFFFKALVWSRTNYCTFPFWQTDRVNSQVVNSVVHFTQWKSHISSYQNLNSFIAALWRQNLYETKKGELAPWIPQEVLFFPFTFSHCCADVMNENILWISLVLHANWNAVSQWSVVCEFINEALL